MTERRARIRKRRRLLLRLGLTTLAVITTTACIFDKGDYQGGGRQDKGATAATGDVDSASPVPTDTTGQDADLPMGLDAAPEDTGVAPVDAADAG